MSVSGYLYFPGCKLTPFLPQYDRSVRAVLDALEVPLTDLELNCCGYPVRSIDFTASMLCGARILARAAAMQLPVLTPCKCCFGNLKQADYWLRHDSGLRKRVNTLLGEEGLQWSQGVAVRHLLSALAEDVGLARIRAAVKQDLDGLAVAVHYGCHALRPGDVTQFDNPLAPTIFENLVTAMGAFPVNWPLRLDCCGHPAWEKNNRVSLGLSRRKLADAQASGALMLVTACTYCQLQFDENCGQGPEHTDRQPALPAVLVTQLLGKAMDLEADALGLNQNHVPPLKLMHP
ncbi:MAG: CoB--CoM heterodisulfide reductase iron-sulfur subunit B family protein [Desulfosarcinaceae bacterium]|jgi:heterodisulfide reductase subunit B